MALVSDVTTTPLSGLNHIDALVNSGPGWNWLTPTRNVIYYTFSVSSGNETGNSSISGITAFNAAQQSACLSQLSYISQLTGITFAAATTGATADLHFAATNILGSTSTSGLCSWSHGWSYNSSNVVTSYSAEAYVYLDNVEWGVQNGTPSSGTQGYETLLHELGHALGLKHPFEGSTRLPTAEDNTANSIMSYTDTGGPYSTFSSYDVAALMWIYGGDGLGGSLGVSTTGKYLIGKTASDTITGGSGNDKLQGLAGNDTINGGTGNDTAVYTGSRSSYAITVDNGVYTVTSSAEGSDTLNAVEYAQFADQTVTLALVATAFSSTGTTGNDSLTGTAGNDVVSGLAGNDTINGGAGSDTLDGGDGIDIALFNGNRANYALTSTASGWTVVSSAEGTDTLTNMEQARFADANTPHDFSVLAAVRGTPVEARGASDMAGAIATQMAVVYLGRPVDSALISSLASLNGGAQPNAAALASVAATAIRDGAFSTNDTSADIVTHTFNNIMGFLPSAFEQQAWGQYIDNGTLTRTNAPWVIFQSYLGANNVPDVYKLPTQARFVAAQTFTDYTITDTQQSALGTLNSVYSNAARAWLSPVDSIAHAASKMNTMIADVESVTITGVAPTDTFRAT